MESKRLLNVMDQQDGLITRVQARTIGLPDGAIRHAIGKGGDWQALLPGIYATFTGPPGELHRLRAAVLYCGADSVVTGPAACRLYRLTYVPASDGLDVLIPHGRQRPVADFVRPHRTRHLPAARFWLATGSSDEDLADVLHAGTSNAIPSHPTPAEDTYR